MSSYSEADRSTSGVDAAALGEWTWDARTDVLTLSPRAATILDIPHALDLSWARMWLLLHPDDREPARLALDEAIGTGSAYRIACRLLHGARLRWIAVSGRPLCDEAGVVNGMRGVVQDISEHMQARDQLRGGHVEATPAASGPADRTAIARSAEERHHAERVQAHLAAIVDSADDGIITKDLDGIIQSWNAAAERIFGYASREIVGRPVLLLIPDDRQAEEGEILARLRRGERIDHVETVRVRKDGREIPVSLTVSPVRDRTGAIIGASKIVRDISAQKAAAAALAAQQAWLQATLESITDAFCALDHDWRFTYVNGVLATKANGFKTSYQIIPLSKEAREALRPGKNVVAVHCKQRGGGQYIDVGLTDVLPMPKK